MSARHHRTSPHRGNRRGAKGGGRWRTAHGFCTKINEYCMK